jgi:hypothetical protein
MKPDDVQLTNEEKATVVINGIIKGCKESMAFWLIMWELGVGYLWYPHMDAVLKDKPSPGDFYLNLVLAAGSAFATALVLGFALCIAWSMWEGMHDHFKKHIDNETEALKQELIKNSERKLLK